MPAPLSADPATLRAMARALDRDGHAVEALECAWRACDLAPADPRGKALVASLLKRAPDAIDPAREAALRDLLDDPSISPQLLVRAGWALLLKAGRIPVDPADAAAWLERDGLARQLLAASFVSTLAIETRLTALRRWLLLTGRWTDHPAGVAALALQATHHGGAWPIDSGEQAALDAARGTAIASAYCPPLADKPALPAYDSALTRSVAAHYVERPYPVWHRASGGTPTSVPAIVAALGPDAPPDLPVAADILIAGCGTGQEAAIWALRCPDARITAIDISPASLAFAAERCAAAGIANIRFEQRDLHEAAGLDRHFDLVVCSGVLHHLADPERGWAAIADVLKPGGVMSLMVYSKYARLTMQRAHHFIRDLRHGPVTDDVLRAARARLIEQLPEIGGSIDFYTLAGVHDLLFHEHEDSFDIERILAGMARLGLDFLGFTLASAAARARYRAEHPDDPWRRDVKAWARLDRQRPHPVNGQHRWWCARPGLNIGRNAP